MLLQLYHSIGVIDVIHGKIYYLKKNKTKNLLELKSADPKFAFHHLHCHVMDGIKVDGKDL